MNYILLDTCVWLDLARDHRQDTLLTALEQLVSQSELTLIVPRIVIEEFLRNKQRVAEESTRSLSSAVKRAREILAKLGTGRGKRLALEHLAEVDYKLPRLGESAIESIGRIERLLLSGMVIDASDSLKLRAAQRAIDRVAPFHRQRNGIDDAIIIETYSDAVRERQAPFVRFAFVTHNIKDFSHPTEDNRMPHPDIAHLFSRIKSRYMTSLAETLRRIQPEMMMDIALESEWVEEPRRLSEILEAMDVLLDKIWYGRHLVLAEAIEDGREKIVDKKAAQTTHPGHRTTPSDIWAGAQRAARKVERKYGLDDLGPWSDFEWGMMNGKLSALRWMLGDEWDMLDT